MDSTSVPTHDSKPKVNIHPLVWPFLLSTFWYGVGSIFSTDGGSSLVAALASLHPYAHVVWGVLAVAVIVLVFAAMYFRKRGLGKTTCLLGSLLWIFGLWCYYFSGSWIPALAVAVPNAFFWFWSFLTIDRHDFTC